MVAALVLYTMHMGADARVDALASSAGTNEMHWVQSDEARELRVIYEPRAWKPWWLESYRGGAIAISETNDRSKRMVASCTKRFGAQVVLTDTATNWDVGGWFEQVRTCPFDSTHPVFGVRVDPNQVQVIRRKEGGAAIRFKLPTSTPPLTTPALLDEDGSAYPSGCSSGSYQGTMANFQPTAHLAFRNCFAD